MKRTNGWILLLALGAALSMFGCSGTKEEPAVTKVAYNQLPLAEGELPDGRGKELLVMHCMACHSPSYITMQPAFPRPVWEAEVKKMVETFGAQVQPYDQKLIVDYLMTIRGNPPLKRVM